MVIRYYILTHYYRAPLDFSFEDIDAVQKSYQRLCKFFVNYNILDLDTLNKNIDNSCLAKSLLETLLDDLNTPAFLAIIFENIKNLSENDAIIFKSILYHILGLDLNPLPEKIVTITPEIQDIIDKRNTARINKNWKEADLLREQLKTLGIDVQDTKPE